MQRHGSTKTAPAGDEAEPVESDYWAEGAQLVVRRGGALPRRCLLCNEPAERLVRRSFHWHEPWLYVLVLFGLLPYLLAAVFAQRSMRLKLPLCWTHLRRFRTGRRLRFAGLVGLVLIPVLALRSTDVARSDSSDVGIAALLGVLAMLFLIVYGERISRITRARRITSLEGRFTASDAFLAACPEHPWDAEGQDEPSS